MSVKSLNEHEHKINYMGKFVARKPIEAWGFLEKLECALNDLERKYTGEMILCSTDVLVLVRRLLDRVPKLDLVEVVRCKDCKHAQRQALKKAGGYVSYVCEYDQEHFTAPNHFCSLGERIENE